MSLSSVEDRVEGDAKFCQLTGTAHDVLKVRVFALVKPLLLRHMFRNKHDFRE